MNKKQMIFLIIIIMTMSFFIGMTTSFIINPNIRDKEQNQVVGTTYRETYQDDVSREFYATLNLSLYFPPEEIPVIVDAGRRNNLNFEQVIILFAIRKAEGGGRGKEFGIMHPRAWNTDLDTQAGWAAATIFKNQQRWEQAGSPGYFIDFLGNVYCPVGAENDPQGLNKHWIPNVEYWIKKIKG